VCTADLEVYQQLRMLRSHGMVREADAGAVHSAYASANPQLNPDFIFAYPAYNARNTEIGGILGRSQLRRLDANVPAASTPRSTAPTSRSRARAITPST
jgi:CDP-6-deoxy-D-xylo-4-hexulose-3-dehydrase